MVNVGVKLLIFVTSEMLGFHLDILDCFSYFCGICTYLKVICMLIVC